MYDYHCGRCGGLVPEPMKAYGYAGKWCHCKEPLPPTEETSTRKFIGLDERGHETNEPTQYVEVLEEETPVYTTTYAFGVVPDTPKTIEEVVAEFPYHRKEVMPSGAEWILIDTQVLRTTLTAQNQAARTAGYQAAVADLSGKPLSAIELMYDEAYARGYKEAEEELRLEVEVAYKKGFVAGSKEAKHGITNL